MPSFARKQTLRRITKQGDDYQATGITEAETERESLLKPIETNSGITLQQAFFSQ
jgi:hypothetical protein